ncbi:MAG TPA: phage holin family protein [Candidatus Binataceae bacterium]|nr:phage holin family protein [Candidatus Binataceae bacterium]
MPQPDEVTRNRTPAGLPAEWPALVSRAVNDVSRILQAEIRLAELGIKNVIEDSIERAIKAALALTMLGLGAVCAVAAAIVGLQVVLGQLWAAFAVVAGAAIICGGGVWLLSMRRTSTKKIESEAERMIR